MNGFVCDENDEIEAVSKKVSTFDAENVSVVELERSVATFFIFLVNRGLAIIRSRDVAYDQLVFEAYKDV